MNEQKARALARATGGKTHWLKPAIPLFTVSLIRGDGRFIMVEEDAGASYADERDCWGSYHDIGDKYLPQTDGLLWPVWGSEAWASGLATLLGGQAHRRGSGWTVAFQRHDGRFVVSGDTWAEVYRDRASYERLDGHVERVEW